MDKIAIIGMGLIGTSLGLALKKAKLQNVEIIGTDRDRGHASKAEKRGAVDKTEGHLLSAIKDAQLVIIATPIMAIRDVMESIGPHLEEGTIVADTGSTKSAVLKWAEQYLPPRVDFVGGHPMAGKEQSGPDAADVDLFKGRAYCIIPGKNARPQSVKTIVNMAEAIGAVPIFLDAFEHDSYVAAVSHLPILMSTALVALTSKSLAWREMSKIASTGYRDITRLASGDPIMSRDICLTNPEGLVYWIDEFVKKLYEIRNIVKSGDSSLEKLFVEAWEARARWQAGVTSEEKGGKITMSDQMSQLFFGGLSKKLAKEQAPKEEDKTKYTKN